MVFLHRDVRFVPEFLPRCLLAPSIVLRRGTDDSNPTTAPFRAHDTSGHICDLQTVPVNIRHVPVPRTPSAISACVPFDAVYIRRVLDCVVRHVVGASILLPMDICWEWEREFLLCYYAGLESGVELVVGGCAVCGFEG